jgi:hypothetical protein
MIDLSLSLWMKSIVLAATVTITATVTTEQLRVYLVNNDIH